MHQSMISLFAFASAAMAAQYDVVVGGSGLSFVPNALTVQVGDTVKFQFFGNHSVAQSTYEDPCIPSEHAPIFSGVIQGPDPSSNDATPSWIMSTTVNETLWLYCSVADHCQKGMSMEIVVGNNPDPDQTLTAYQAAAVKVSASKAPDTVEGGVAGTDGGSSSSSGTASASAGTVTAAPTGNTTATTTALSTTFTSKASTVTATKSGSASATGSGAPTVTGAAGKQAHIPVALGFAGILGGLAALI